MKPISHLKHAETLAPAAPATDTSKSVMGKLPARTNVGKWHHSLISTYIRIVSSSANPWDIPPKYSIEILQKLWDTFFPNIPQVVTVTSPIYKKASYCCFIMTS